MKRKIAALLLCIGLTGCALLEPAGPPEWRDSPQSEDAPPSEAQQPENGAPEASGPEYPEATMLEGVEGVHILLEADSAGAEATPTQMLELFNLVVVAWQNSEEGPLLLEGYSTHTGERRFTKSIEGAPYYIEDTGELTENYRVVGENAITYLSSADSEAEEVYTLPETVASQLYAPEGTGAPYDYARQADLLAYCRADGIYISDGEGNDPRRLMSGEEAVRWFNYVGFDLPPYTWDQVRFVAPLLMNGGKQVAATAWIEGAAADGAAGRCVYVSTVDVETGQYSNYPDPLAEDAGPAERRGGNTLTAAGEFGCQTISVVEETIEEIPYEVALAQQAFVFEEGIVEGEPMLALVNSPDAAAGGGEGAELLSVTGYRGAQVLYVGLDYLLCRVEGDGASRLLLVPYEKNGV